MSENKKVIKKTVPTWASVLLGVTLLVALFLTAYLIPTTCDKPAAYVAQILDCLAYLVALFYCISGYKKSSALFFHLFCAVYMVTELMTVFARSFFDSSTITGASALFTSVITFGLLCVFNLGRNLGKNKSYSMSTVIVFLAVADVILSLFLIPVIGLANISNAILLLLGKLVLSIVFLFMVYAKYSDKDARGTV